MWCHLSEIMPKQLNSSPVNIHWKILIFRKQLFVIVGLMDYNEDDTMMLTTKNGIRLWNVGKYKLVDREMLKVCTVKMLEFGESVLKHCLYSLIQFVQLYVTHSISDDILFNCSLIWAQRSNTPTTWKTPPRINATELV